MSMLRLGNVAIPLLGAAVTVTPPLSFAPPGFGPSMARMTGLVSRVATLPKWSSVEL
jgi:hypothetical protein